MSTSLPFDIRGTYTLARRELPDGTVQKPPQVFGLHTFAKTHRHTSVTWKDAEGKTFSLTYGAVYKLTPTEYSETLTYLNVDDQISGNKRQREFSGPTEASPIAVDGNVIKFTAPQAFEKEFSLRFEFEKDGFRAISGEFTDHWERV